MFEFFLGHAPNLRIVQYTAPLDWLCEERLSRLSGDLTNLEMFLLSNTRLDGMRLGMDSVRLLIDVAPNLTVLGNLV